MNAQKLVDYSLSSSEIEDASELTPIQFRGKRVHRYIIRSPSVDLDRPLEHQPTTKMNKKDYSHFLTRLGSKLRATRLLTRLESSSSAGFEQYQQLNQSAKTDDVQPEHFGRHVPKAEEPLQLRCVQQILPGECRSPLKAAASSSAGFEQYQQLNQSAKTDDVRRSISAGTCQRLKEPQRVQRILPGESPLEAAAAASSSAGFEQYQQLNQSAKTDDVRRSILAGPCQRLKEPQRVQRILPGESPLEAAASSSAGFEQYQQLNQSAKTDDVRRSISAGTCQRLKEPQRLRWKPPPPLPPGSSSTSSLTNQQKPTTFNRSISAGTCQRRKSRCSSDVYSKFFRENVDISFGELDLDDTLVKAVFTTPPEQVKCMRRPFMLRPINPLEDVEDNSLDSSGGVYGGLGR
ncbi:hypothetical protein GPALN_011772 [Globodera pallida]|nr:hypothetical protein GPALN_011772 [Globodera pallida]